MRQVAQVGTNRVALATQAMASAALQTLAEEQRAPALVIAPGQIGLPALERRRRLMRRRPWQQQGTEREGAWSWVAFG